jgi:class 3 adenylate cyclase
MTDVMQGPAMQTPAMQTPAGSSDAVDLHRRHVAVVFADLSGFTALVDSVEPEVVYARVRPVIDQLVTLVEFHGGEIQQVLGDGFMAVFGLGGAAAERGDEVTRAVQAGIALVCAGSDTAGRLPVHVGIEAGEVLVSRSWQPARFAVWGRAVTVATRLCDIAGPGTVNIGPRAYEAGGRGVVERWGARLSGPDRVRARGFARELTVYAATPQFS